MISPFNKYLPPCIVQAQPASDGREDKQKGGPKVAGEKQEGWLSREVVTRGTCTCGCTMALWTGVYHSPDTLKMLLSGTTGKENKRQVNIKSRREIDRALSSAVFEHIYDAFQGLQM